MANSSRDRCAMRKALKNERLTKISAALLKHEIAYDFYQNKDGEAGIRWRHNGEKYHVWQTHINGPVFVSYNIAERPAGGVSQTYIVNFIAALMGQER